MLASDINAPEFLNEIRWMGAISAWLAGTAEPLIVLIRDPSVGMTDDAREFLAGIVGGKVKRSRGAPLKYPPWVERSMVAEVFAVHESLLASPKSRGGTPQNRAIETVAERRGTTVDSVRGFVAKLRKAGITLERWQKWGRPDFKNPRK